MHKTPPYLWGLRDAQKISYLMHLKFAKSFTALFQELECTQVMGTNVT